MAVTPVQEIAISTADNATAIAQAYSAAVTSGNLLVIVAGRYDGGADTAFVAGDCTQSAGTATIGTITLDEQSKSNVGGSPCQIGIWSAPVTGTGTCTMQVAGAAGSYFFIVPAEYSGLDVSASRIEDTSANTGTSTSPATTGNVTTADAGLMMAGLVTDFSGPDVNPVIGGSFVSLGTVVDATAHQTGAVARRIVTSGTADQASWTLETSGLSGWAAILVAYKAAGGGGSTAGRLVGGTLQGGMLVGGLLLGS